MSLRDHMVIADLVFEETARLSSRAAVPLYIPAVYEESISPHPCRHLVLLPIVIIVTMFYFHHSDRCVVISHRDFNLHSSEG